jgi:PAS domain S-box-containing protein
VNTALLVTSDEALRLRLSRALPNLSIFEATNDAEALDILRLTDIDVVICDTVGAAAWAEFVARVKEASGESFVIAVGASEEERAAADVVIPRSFTPNQLAAAVRHADERRRLVRELAVLRAQRPPAGGVGPSTAAGWEISSLPTVVREFTRLLAAGFDLPRALEMFLDGVGKLVRPARSALLLRGASTDGSYRIVAQRALAPQIVRSIRLSKTTGLCRWLAAQGRPACLPDLTDADVVRELTLLQAVVAIPLVAQGDLVGLLALGQPVVNPGYSREETETLFDLATHFATAVRDIALHHQLEQEKEFSERILASMSSGVVTIGRDHRIGAFNRRAEEILGIPASKALQQDLRILPSPLGDMLFETLTRGHALPRSEIRLALRKLWLEVSTYPIYADESATMGAVLVFEDVTAQKELALQTRQAAEAQLLTRVVARIAEEIKNPLVSINSFVELLDEQYDDPEFRKTFTALVHRDAWRLVQVIETLTGLVGQGTLDFTVVDAHSLLAGAPSTITVDKHGEKSIEIVDASTESAPLLVKVDVAQTRKALSYLIGFLAHNTPGDIPQVTCSVARHTSAERMEEAYILIASATAAVDAERLQSLFDPVQMVQQSLIDVGPAVSQRLIEAQGGRLRRREGRRDLSFLVSFPLVAG